MITIKQLYTMCQTESGQSESGIMVAEDRKPKQVFHGLRKRVWEHKNEMAYNQMLLYH